MTREYDSRMISLPRRHHASLACEFEVLVTVSFKRRQ